MKPDDEMFAALEVDYDVPNADWMNKTRKYVASSTLVSPEWNNSVVGEGDLAEVVRRLKQERKLNSSSVKTADQPSACRGVPASFG